ncbi:MAG: preprotein translocase YidC, partial [Lachnospiraceae bacterium]|nr:preprotein translocase YidC [Lachnospiraceae bacterium]
LNEEDGTVIVEFGNNKNCRIPMVKEAIIEVEKPEDALKVQETVEKKKK